MTRSSGRPSPRHLAGPAKSADRSSANAAGSSLRRLASRHWRDGPPPTWHAPETECIGKEKARTLYEFGVKVSPATTNKRRKGGQFILHTKALPGNPYDGHTLKEVIEETETLTGREIERAYVDKGYQGHDASNPHRVFKSGQKRGVHGQIKKELRRRSAIEAVIGHCKTDGHLDRSFLKGRDGDQINAVMSAVGYNLRLILKWLRKLLRKIIVAIWAAITPRSVLKQAY